MPEERWSYGYGELRDRLVAAIDWLTAMGAPPPPKSRFLAYVGILEELIVAAKDGTREELEARFDEYSDVLFEANDLVEIHGALSSLSLDKEQRPAFRKKLSRIISGPVRRVDENESDPKTIIGRNTSLELLIAARFARAGYPPHYELGADTTVKHDGRKIFVECKRCRSEGKIVTRFNEALKQCESRISQSASKVALGIAVVDFSVVGNPSGGTLRFANDDAATAALQGMVKSFLDEFFPQVALKGAPRVLGLLVRFSAMIATHKFNHAQQWAFADNPHLVPTDRLAFDAVAARLAAQLNAELQN